MKTTARIYAYAVTARDGRSAGFSYPTKSAAQQWARADRKTGHSTGPIISIDLPLPKPKEKR